MINKLNSLNKEDLIEIISRIYEIHQKDVEYYTAKENSLLLNVHKTRVERIENYVESAIQNNKRKAVNEQTD